MTENQQAAQPGEEAPLAAPQVDAETAMWAEMDAAEKVETPADPNDADFAQDDAAPQSETGQEQPAEQAQQPAEQPGPDIWANATPEQRAAYEATERKARELEQQRRSDEGRVAAFQRKYEELRKQTSTQPPAKRQSAAEALEALRNDYPELAEPLAKALEPFEQALTQQDADRNARREADAAEVTDHIRAETQRLEQKHQGYEAFLRQNGAAFREWVEDQPRRIRDAAYRNAEVILDAQAADEVLTLFKAHIAGPPNGAASGAPATQHNAAPLNDRRQRQMGATVSVRGSRRPALSGVPEDGDPEAIWDAFDRVESARA